MDLTGNGLTAETPRRQAELSIATYVECLPMEHLPKLVLPELNHYGRLPVGYSQRWSQVSMAGLKHDADIVARGNERVSMNTNPWPPDSSSSSQSREASDNGNDKQQRPKGSDRHSSDETIKKAP